MKFLALLAAVLASIALVSADSPAASGADKGKVPQLIELITKLEAANPADAAFLTTHAADIPELVRLHKAVAAESNERQVRFLYGSDDKATKLLEIVQKAANPAGVQKRAVNKSKGEKKVKGHKARKKDAKKDSKKEKHHKRQESEEESIEERGVEGEEEDCEKRDEEVVKNKAKEHREHKAGTKHGKHPVHAAHKKGKKEHHKETTA